MHWEVRAYVCTLADTILYALGGTYIHTCAALADTILYALGGTYARTDVRVQHLLGSG